MAKLVVTYEGNTIKRKLIFNGDTYTYTMLPTETGKISDVPAFDTQIKDKYPEIDEEILQAAEKFSFGDDEEIEEALEFLTDVEN